ncbi:MAG: M28 family peptidase, partial [Bacteroidales bacterium]|nr:M28 family peptidase [Bacteroidales bacterium]
EVGMMGMKAIWEKDREVFDNVGFMINIEARGPWGPVLLFEACPGNEKVIDLYSSAAEYPFTYSLTTVVYKFMPNYTDFKVVKDSIPGLNFSTIVDVNHYHTDLDNFSNVSPKSIQHYGAQILPVAQKYLTDSGYSDKNSLKADADATNFTIPLLGLFNFSEVGYVIFNVIIFLLFLLVFSLDGIRGRMRASETFKISVSVLGLSIAALAAGELVAYLCSLAAGAKFKPFGIITGIRFDNVAMLISTIAFFALTVWGYLLLRGRAVQKTAGSMRANAAVAAASKYACTILYGTLSLMFLLSVVLLIALGENLMFFVPLCFATGGVILWRLTGCKFMLVLAIVAILLHAFSFLYALAMALTIGAYGAIAMLAFCDFMVLIPLADLYLSPFRRK